MAEREIVNDLFGQPVALPSDSVKGRRGRPAHQWSLEVENKVLMGLALNWTVQRIAAGLGITEPTLRKHYFSALKLRDMARDQYELNRACKLQRQANDGNVGASKELHRMFEKQDRIKAQQSKADDAPLGAKAQRGQRAKEAMNAQGDKFGTGWAH